MMYRPPKTASLAILVLLVQAGFLLAETPDPPVSVKVPGGQELVIFQISDSHLSGMTPTDELMADGKRMRDAYAPDEARRKFLSVLSLAGQSRADLIVLSGDIFNYPSADAVSFVRAQLKKTGIPFAYINGNHDWHFEGEEGTLGALRSKWSRSVLAPLFPDRQYKGYSFTTRGYRILMLDDSDWQFDSDQAKIVEEALSAPEPVIVVAHVPLFAEGNADSPLLSCGNPSWGFETDTGYLLEKRERLPRSGNSPETMAVIRAIRESGKVVAVLSGHIHKPRTDMINVKVRQYSSRATVLGGYQVVRIAE